MVLSDYNGQIIWVNTKTEWMFGYSRDELVGKEVEILSTGAVSKCPSESAH